jgi:hypothetical protein
MLSIEANVSSDPSAQSAPGDVTGGEDQEHWQELKDRADAGEVNASCKLAQRLQGCRRAAELRDSIDEALTLAAARNDLDSAEIIARQEIDMVEADGRCGAVIPREVVLQEWKYLLKAAQAGHEPSMYQFVLNPPIDQARPLEYLDAIQAYDQYALTFVERLLASGSAEGLVAAVILESGTPIIGSTSLSSGDPVRRVELAAALAVLRNKPAILDSTLASLGGQIDERVRHSAIASGQRRSASFAFRFADTSLGVEVDQGPTICDEWWRP